MKMQPFCPICGSTELIDFNQRRHARCANCGAMERTRLLHQILNREGVLSREISVLHIAPEPGLALRLRGLAKRYVPADIDISKYVSFMPEAYRIDLCNFNPEDLGQFDLIIHMHVLEHVPCPIDGVLKNFTKLLAPGGRMYFSVPVRRNATSSEDTSPSLTDADRIRLFGQNDHVRIFGDQDVVQLLTASLGDGLKLVEPLSLFSPQEIKLMGVNIDVSVLSGHSIFRYEASSVPPASVAAKAVESAKPAKKGWRWGS